MTTTFVVTKKITAIARNDVRKLLVEKAHKSVSDTGRVRPRVGSGRAELG